MRHGAAINILAWISAAGPRSRLRLAVGLFLLMIFVCAAASLFAVTRPFRGDAASQALHIGGHFTLTTPDGRVVTDRSFRGKWLIIYFGYTFCPDACPTALNDISVALEQIGPLADKVQPLFITVDPERDTAQVMANYVGSFDPRFIGLRGTREQTATAAEQYRVYYTVRLLGRDEYAVDHSSFIYVMNPEGEFVKILTGDLPGHQMADDLRQLIR
ncbi:MAG: SCO family protein [Methylocella sp.]